MPTSVESLGYAFQRGICRLLDVDSSDIGVSWRWLSKRSSPEGVEIILYDNAPGGSGFVKEAYDNWATVLENARDICKSCTCEKACYDCLKSYGNQSHHEKLDRKSVLRQLTT